MDAKKKFCTMIAAEKKRSKKTSQKVFVIGLIDQALTAHEAQKQPEEGIGEE